MIDMHSHILFDVDDGAKNIDESINLIKLEVEKGVSHIILTPHFKSRVEFYNKGNVINNFNLLKDLVETVKLDVKIYLGNEIYYDSNFFENLDNGSIFTLADSKYILIEFSMINTPENIAEICYEVKLKGFIPIIAHVERYINLFEDKRLLIDILNECVHLQVNASAILKKDGKECYKFAKYLLKNKLVSFVASDVHNEDTRKFYMDKAYERVSKVYGLSYADKIFSLNQQKIIGNEYFDCPKFSNKVGILSKLFNNNNKIQ